MPPLLEEKVEQYLGFAADQLGNVHKVYGYDSETPTRIEHSELSLLSENERAALEQDRSPVLYHWNNLLHVDSASGSIRPVYCRGKDFLPFSGLDQVEQIVSRRSDPSLGPVTLQMQPNQICNDDCVFCCTVEYREDPIYKGKRFSYQEWNALLENHAATGGKVVEIIGGGEPTLHPQFLKILKSIIRLGLKAYLFTNGSQLAKLDGSINAPLVEALAEACAILTVSLDGYRQRDKVHRNIPWKKTEGTFRAIEKINTLRDPQTMGFYNSFILTGGRSQPSNIDDLEDCIRALAPYTDSIHIQNDFVTLSHREFEVEKTQSILQSTIDTYFKDLYIYYNYPLIDRFNLRVPYNLSLHNVTSEQFTHCYRSLVAPTVECGSYKVWPCGRYAGMATAADQCSFESIGQQLRDMRTSPDYKSERYCDFCIHSSYNKTLQDIAQLLDEFPMGSFYHFYEKHFVERTMSWPHVTDYDTPLVTESFVRYDSSDGSAFLKVLPSG